MLKGQLQMQSGTATRVVGFDKSFRANSFAEVQLSFSPGKKFTPQAIFRKIFTKSSYSSRHATL